MQGVVISKGIDPGAGSTEHVSSPQARGMPSDASRCFLHVALLQPDERSRVLLGSRRRDQKTQKFTAALCTFVEVTSDTLQSLTIRSDESEETRVFLAVSQLIVGVRSACRVPYLCFQCTHELRFTELIPAIAHRLSIRIQRSHRRGVVALVFGAGVGNAPDDATRAD